MKLTLGFSPCPNDTFIFDALVHKKIDTGGFDVDVMLEDVETLNQWASVGKLDITKMSFAASCFVQDSYQLLQSGAALGFGVGPLLISNRPITLSEAKNIKIAIPGERTTAHFLFNYFNQANGEKIFMPFHAIEQWVLNEASNETRLGVIIHESRFTYQQKGLYQLQDLGTYWEQKTGLPIPLGGIFMRKNFPAGVMAAVDQLIRASIEYAFTNYTTSLPPFVTSNAQEMSEEVMWQHIKLYVNDYSLDIGSKGLAAYAKMKELITG
jgi:1,4-dihydroxy-6-naphthoate synthase